LSIKHPKQNGITAMALMRTNGFGITLAGMKFQWARLTHIPSKVTMQNFVIIWLVLLVDRVAFHAAHMHLNALCGFSFIVSMADNFISNAFLTTPRILCTSLALPFSHSLFYEAVDVFSSFVYNPFAALIVQWTEQGTPKA
jgi:hypothetical protein